MRRTGRPGPRPGGRGGGCRWGVRAMSAVCRAAVPLACVVVRRAYGIAGSAMSNAERFPYRFAWPSGGWGSLPIEGGIEVAYRAELEAAEEQAAPLHAEPDRTHHRATR